MKKQDYFLLSSEKKKSLYYHDHGKTVIGLIRDPMYMTFSFVRVLYLDNFIVRIALVISHVSS